MNSSPSADPILFALSFDGEGGAREVGNADLAKAVRSSRTVWIHLNYASKDCRSVLENLIPDLDPSTISALLSEDVRGRATERNDGILAVIRGANLHKDYQPEQMNSLRCFLRSSVVVTIRKYQIFAVEDLIKRFQVGTGPIDSADFLVQLSHCALGNLEKELEKLEDEIDEMEDLAMEQPENLSREGVLEARRSVHHFLRHLLPQRDVYQILGQSTVPWVDEDSRIQLQELHQTFIRIVADLKSWKERTRLLQDEISNSLAQKLNEKLYLLSILTAVFLPLSFMTGLFGINVGGIPGESEPWAFWTFTWLLLILVALELYIFKTRRWF